MVFPNRLLTIAKISAIIFLLAATSYITWQVAQRDMDKERLAVASHQLEIERQSTKQISIRIRRTSSIALKLPNQIRNLTFSKRNIKGSILMQTFTS